MPELPEVQTVVTTIRPRVIGRAITSIAHLRDDIVHPIGFDLRRAIKRRTIASVERRGKRIVFTLEDENRFYIHLGMTGRLTVERADAPIEKHTHLVGRLSNRRPNDRDQELRFRDPRRFGGIFWLGKTDDPAGPAPLGPEPLTIKTRDLAARLSRTKRAIKSALLDQSVVAGLGNIYVDESLFLARIHPLKRADRLSRDDVTRLTRAIKTTLNRAIRHRGSTLRDYVDADGKRGGFQLLHRVYDRAEKPCRLCRTTIVRIVLSGRSTHFCPQCQPSKSARAARAAKSAKRAARPTSSENKS